MELGDLQSVRTEVIRLTARMSCTHCWTTTLTWMIEPHARTCRITIIYHCTKEQKKNQRTVQELEPEGDQNKRMNLLLSQTLLADKHLPNKNKPAPLASKAKVLSFEY